MTLYFLPTNEMTRAAYQAPRRQFLDESSDAIIGALTANAFFAVELTQRNAWLSIIEHLRETFKMIDEGFIFLEFTIPRMGRRVDAIILYCGSVFVLEYKVGSGQFSPADIDQTVGYALDLKNFHETSHSLPIFPVLIATAAKSTKPAFEMAADSVSECILSNGNDFAYLLRQASAVQNADEIDPLWWVDGRYKPTPTIVEAAQALYRNHQVVDITRNEAGAENLSITAAYVSSIIETCKCDRRKAICFITGVPGSGKTLAGLNIASTRTRIAYDEYAVFLSGNGPLVKVLRAALTRDQKHRAKIEGKATTGKRDTRSVEQFIQNIHHFRDTNVNSQQPPIEKVALFDEAQRAWDKHTTSQFMRKKRNCPDFNESEPEFLLSVMDRHEDWCTVICLVGSGQEINTGEAGIGEWLSALAVRFPTWQVHMSNSIAKESASIALSGFPNAVFTKDELHLSTTIRSFRSDSVSAFVSAMIDGKPHEASIFAKTLGNFEFRITRDANHARNWLRSRRRGTERAGMVAFSNGMRLKSEGLFVKSKINPVEWFLAARSDVRSSDYLEDIATEFDIQGLELDWTCVCIDANLRVQGNGSLVPVAFRGTKWQAVNDVARRKFIINAHRVLPDPRSSRRDCFHS